MRLGTFDVEFSGPEYSQYFQGHCQGNYKEMVTGIGISEEEAFEACVDQLPDFDISEIYKEVGTLETEEETEEDLYHRVAIKWNNLEEERLEKLKKLVEPLKYVYYQSVPSKDPLGFIAWETVSEAENVASYDDFKITTWKEADYFYFLHTTGSDYSGSNIEAANCKWLIDNYEVDWLTEVYGGHNTFAIAICVSKLIASNDFDDIIEIIEALENYPLIDDETLQELEVERIDEAWELEAQNDFIRVLEKEFSDYEFNWPDDLWIFFNKKAEEANVYWVNERQDMVIDIDAIVKEITFEDIKKWVIKYEVSYIGIGPQIAIYYNKDAAYKAIEVLRNNFLIIGKYDEI